MAGDERAKQRAIELARTGEHIDCLTIEIALEREGYAAAFEVCRDEEFRAALKTICDSHWQSDAGEQSTGPGMHEDAASVPAAAHIA